MRAEDLLSIDVRAEARKLATATLDGPWQVPGELVRRALAAGARRVEVDLGRRRLVVRDDAAEGIGPDLQCQLEALLDLRCAAERRHEALLALEKLPGLLALAALQPTYARIEARGTRGTTIDVGIEDFDPEAALRWLRSRARFAEAAIVVDGVRLPGGFRDALFETALEAPLSGRLAVSPGLEAARVWLLDNGVVSAHITVPEVPAFEAAIEMHRLTGDASPAALREAITPHLGPLADQAVRAMLDLATGDVSDEHRRLLRRALLLAGGQGRRREAVLRAPLYRVVLGPEGRGRRWAGLAELDLDRPLPCLEPGAMASHFLLPREPVVFLDAEERGLLSQRLGVRFWSVKPCLVRPGWHARLRSAVRAVREGLRNAASRAVRFRLGRRLPTAALRPPERALLQALRDAVPAEDISITDGSAAPRKVDGSWCLPRRHPDTAAAARLVARDPSWTLLAVLTLLDAESAAGPRAVDSWRRRLETPLESDTSNRP